MKNQKGTSNLRFHHGHALGIIAETYPKLLNVILEIIQNGIDAEAKRIQVIINHQENLVIVRDNGEGVSIAQFEKALSEVGVSQKKKGKLGQFGRGLISPFGKCQSFEFMSCAKRRGSQYIRWTFTNDLLEQQSNLVIPSEAFPSYKHVSEHSDGIWYRSEMKLNGVTSDTAIRKISVQTLVADTLNAFGVVMARKGISIELQLTDESGKVEEKTFNAHELRGTKIGTFTYENNGVETIIEVNKANKVGGKYNGVFLVSSHGDDFTIPLRNVLNPFSNQGLLDSETIQGLNSGFFEGRIVSTIDLNPNRKSFHSNDHFFMFLSHLETFYKEVGSGYIEEFKSDTRMERYEQIGTNSMKILDNLLNKPNFQDLKGLFEGMGEPLRVVGSETHPVKNGGDVEFDPSKVGTGKVKPKPETSSSNNGKTDGEGLGFRNRKKYIRSNVTGLKFSYDEMPGSSRLYGFDPRYGVVNFNIRHPVWEVCEKRDSALMRLQEEVALHILTSLQLPESNREIVETAFEKALPAKVFLMMHAPSLIRKKTTDKASQETLAALAAV